MKTHPDMLPIGAPAPDFQLKGVDGKNYRLEDFGGEIFVFVQGCNHCPYVVAYLDRLKRLANDYQDRGVRFVMVNSNDAERYPEDGYEAMQAFADEHELPFPYLFDEAQEVAMAYRTFRTPELLVFDRDRKLAYHGRIDDSAKEPDKVTSQDLRDALESLLAGEGVAQPETYAIGCTVKWKEGNEPQVSWTEARD
ncbi:MAG: thioredoxin family protein [Deinococcota bacterium]|jgi:peroxiredoxin|nr:thioredoxin family protein [Deinococcota bacterium]